MKPVQIAPDIYWVGAVDWNIRDFHGYSTKEGTTYNAFLIMDEKITLIDTVKKEFFNDMISKISMITDPGKIDYVISNHTEMDHSGSLPRLMAMIGKEKPVYCSAKGYENLSLHFHNKDINYKPVEDAGSLNTGKRDLIFLETRMLHWPDSMFTYSPAEKILFSSDAFGQHYASHQRFDDETGPEVMIQAQKYFANILLLYAPLIIKLLSKVNSLGLEFNMICPDHGIIWRRDINKIINAYKEWSEQKPSRKAVIFYDTMWHSTEKMAEAILAGLADNDIDTKILHIRTSHRSDIITETLDAAAIIAGSPTLNNMAFPTVMDVMTYMKGLKPKNKIAGTFGSYGWSGESVKIMKKEFEEMKIEVTEGPNIKFVPDKNSIEDCYKYGAKIAAMIKSIC